MFFPNWVTIDDETFLLGTFGLVRRIPRRSLYAATLGERYLGNFDTADAAKRAVESSYGSYRFGPTS